MDYEIFLTSMIHGMNLSHPVHIEALFGSALAPMLLRLSSVEETSPLILGEKNWSPPNYATPPNNPLLRPYFRWGGGNGRVPV